MPSGRVFRPVAAAAALAAAVAIALLMLRVTADRRYDPDDDARYRAGERIRTDRVWTRRK
jgi:hypothetical protein